MQVVQQESTYAPAASKHPPIRYVSGHNVYLLDTQTGTLLRFGSTGTEGVQLYPKK